MVDFCDADMLGVDEPVVMGLPGFGEVWVCVKLLRVGVDAIYSVLDDCCPPCCGDPLFRRDFGTGSLDDVGTLAVEDEGTFVPDADSKRLLGERLKG
jgi:hypothetical protein